MEVIAKLYSSLIASSWVGEKDVEVQLTSKDIQIAAPDNVQDEKLKQAISLGGKYRFEIFISGTEAPVVMYF